MSSFKDTFEPKVFAASTFASGTWRGASTLSYDVAGIETTVPNLRLHALVNDGRLHGTVPNGRLHSSVRNQRLHTTVPNLRLHTTTRES